MANRHKAQCKAGGGAMKGRDNYSGTGEPNVTKEARSDKNFKGGGKVAGSKGKSRVRKARGGGVGSDQHPFSSAHRG